MENIYFTIRFPLDENMKLKWLLAINANAQQGLADDAIVCGDHFAENDYTDSFGKKELSQDAVPFVR